jgi:hypothetical protein
LPSQVNLILDKAILNQGDFQAKKENTMSMYFLDDTEDWPEYKIIKNEIHRLEKEYFEFIKKLQEAESALRFDIENAELNAKVDQLKKKLKKIEKRLNESLNMYR